MPDITRSTGNVRATHPRNAEIYDGQVSEAVLEGQAIHLHTTGKLRLADSNVAGRQQARGIALNSAGTGRTGVSYLRRGTVAGFDLSGLAYDALVYLSDTVGEFSTTAGTMSAPVGRVTQIPDGGIPTKVILFEFPITQTFA